LILAFDSRKGKSLILNKDVNLCAEWYGQWRFDDLLSVRWNHWLIKVIDVGSFPVLIPCISLWDRKPI
jgi:hypothetical protein